MAQRIAKASVLAAAVLFLSVASGARAADIKAVISGCENCHDKDGASTAASVPIIGGFSSAYIVDEIADYRKKERPCPPTEVRAGDKKGTKTDMCEVVKDLSDADAKQVADFFSGKKFVRATQSFDAALAKKGEQIHQQNCEKCHSKGGSLADDDSGILAGQWMAYLKEQMTMFVSGKRIADLKMKPVIAKLDDAGFDALVNYYASLK